MKKRVLSSIGVLMCASALIAATPVDEELFVSPNLTDLAGKIAYDAGSQLSNEKRQSYDHAFSVNCGKNLPSTMHVMSNSKSQKACYMVGLGTHINQLADALKKDGKAYIVTPANYGVVFSDLSMNEVDVKNHVDQVLKKMGKNCDNEMICKALSELKEVNHATFMMRDGALQLVTDEKSLALGEKIWRKSAEGVTEEIYHSEEEYLVAIRNSGLECEEVRRPCFFGEVKWKAYNSSRKDGEAKLGAAYVDHNPFTIFVVTKKAV